MVHLIQPQGKIVLHTTPGAWMNATKMKSIKMFFEMSKT
ncbi:MAG: hypothetical protein ACI8RD_013135 [Bacillariaceae sp.]|jgi:hypothetical protein